MGGGGGGGFSQSDKNHLEKKSKEHIAKAGEAKNHNVFISFAHENLDEVNLLRGQAKKEDSDLEFSDYSVKKAFESEDAVYIKRQIHEKIERTSVTMVYLSNESMKSPWVKWEIDQSIKMGKGVIGVYKGDISPKNIPKHIKDNTSSIVPWKHDSIMKAVNNASEKR